jgi:hypothetical protein
MSVELAPHQRKAVNALDNGKILWGGVGSGKTRTSLAYYVKKETPRDIYVITTAKKRDSRDWEEEGATFGIGKEEGGTLHGRLVVDSWNNIQKYKDVHGAFFIFDEQRLVGSGTWVKSFLNLARKNRWILLSATPGDSWLDYIPVFVANGFYKNRTEFKREHVVYNTYSKFPKVDRYVSVGRLVRLKNQLLVEMPFDRHTVRHVETIKVDHDKDLFHKATIGRWHVYEERPLRDVAELFLVMRKIVNSDPSRLAAIRELMKYHHRLIIFYNFDYELEILRTLAGDLSLANVPPVEEPCPMTKTGSSQLTQSLSPSASKSSTNSITETAKTTTSSSPSPTKTRSDATSKDATGNCPTVAIAEWNGHKHEEVPDTDRWIYLVQYTAGSEGWNCITTNAVVFYSLTYSYKQFEQAHGRIDRMNTPFIDLYYYILQSDSVIDRAVRNALNHKESFQESKFAPKKLATK